jgi:hypothetical protein
MPNTMSLTIPPATRAVLDALESSTEPTVDYEISGKLSIVLQTPDLTTDERNGAWAEFATKSVDTRSRMHTL